MGIDLVKRGRIKGSNKKNTRSTNLYIHLLIKLFRFLSRRTDSAFTKTVLRRLVSSRVNRPPISLTSLVKNLKGQDKTAVIVGTVTDDIRLLEVPKLTVAALRFTETARARILKAGGKCLTLDQLVMAAPTGTNTLLLRATKDREAKKHFGPAPGVPGSHTKPFIRAKGHNFEKGKK
uniref:Large ribosomal subunit protein uL15/eL18 domain-containing protein n=1 Tax=Strombidium rassoulzadegani TaxID=1082188 RepID=A0A7S3CHH6_9SPIT|mmetsp:Transcript_10006/g.16811  ORF Transcript_10006/g.16811 Transcript_10006/m.16811 type:complete len:177 (+) Transcript_10006:46-576(+)